MIELNWTLLLQFVNFVVLLAVLNVICYRPFRRLMLERQQTVDGSYQRARELEVKINEKMENYQLRLQEAKMKGHQEKAELRKGALADESRVLGESRRLAGEQVQALRDRIAAEAADARQALRQESQVLAGQVAGQILGRKI
ncbi:MAG: ATP synthase F0 subunit B [Desulfuromonadales bacterium]